MIIFVQGKITHKNGRSIILENQGIGYQIFLNEADLKKSEIGRETKFFTHEYLREDKRELYGLRTFEDLRFFLKLLTVSGIGPKLAQSILALGFDKIKKAVEEGKVSLLTTISGLGLKKAQKIILELKGSLTDILSGVLTKEEKEIESALKNLGYSEQEIKNIIRDLPENIKSVDEKIKAALKMLARK